MNKYSWKNIDLINLLFLGLTPIFAIILTVIWINNGDFHWGQVLMGIIFYIFTGMSITGGYHRLFAHKAYDAHVLVKLFYLLFGAASFENSVLKWGSDHRRHHNKVDTEEDPYNINEGFFYAHMGWVFLKKNSTIHEKYAQDFLKDKLIMWQHNYYMYIAVAMGIILPTILGGVFFDSYLGGFAVGGLGRIVLTHHCTFFINSLCHKMGSTPYTDTNSAKDHWFMALLTFGEGYHNFHHYFQNDYRNGIRWFHFDPTKWLIKTLSYSGLASKLRLTSQDKILAAKMQMKLKQMKLKTESADLFSVELEKLKLQAIDTLKKLQAMKDEYKNLKSHASRELLVEFKLKMRSTQEEFRRTVEQWEALANYYRLAVVRA